MYEMHKVNCWVHSEALSLTDGVSRAGCLLEVRIIRVLPSKFCFEDQIM